MKNLRLFVLVAFSTLMVIACGGGGNSPSTNPGSSTPPLITPILYATSYENMKAQGLSQLNLGTNSGQYTSAWAAGNFFGDGSMVIMVAKSNSLNCYTVSGVDPTCLGPAPRYIKDDRRAEFQFFKLDASNNLVATGKAVQGCLTPRKAIVADFNKDGHPDIFVACHGWDATINGQWAFEPSRLLINDSQGKGNFSVSDVGPTDYNADGSGYYHGASAADINGDGYPDVVLTDNFRAAGKNVTTLINQKTNPVTFAVDDTRITGQSAGPYFSVELYDFDGDGKVDIIASGAEAPSGNADTVILYNDGTGNFGTRKTVITPIPAYLSPLDFTVIDKAAGEKVLYLGRVSADYSSQAVQAYNLKTNASFLVWTGDRNWVEWWLPVTKTGVKGIAPYANTRNSGVFISP
jgi:hypothetical protein